MGDREQILRALRSRPPAAPALPPHDGPWQRFAEPWARFAEVLESVGGVCLRVPDPNALAAALDALPVWQQATRRLSLLAQVPGTEPLTIDTGGDAAAIDIALLPGRFAVAENAAVWVDERDVPHRALFHVPQHVALVVAACDLVHNMHEAYDRLVLGEQGFGCFVSGPSKTADIEQALVIGAHGPRSLTAIVVGRPD